MSNTNPQFGSARTFSLQGQGILTQLIAIVIFLAIIVALFFIVLPLAIVLFFVGLIAYAIFRIKRAFRRAHEPNGPLDGRRNVRVVQRDE